MLRPNASTVLLSVIGLSLASFTFACSGSSSDNSDVDSSKLAVQKQKDGKPTGDGKTCSWGIISVPPTVVGDPPPPSGGSSGGCETDANGTYHCWAYDADGKQVDGEPSGTGSTTSSTSSSGGSSGSSGGCTTDDQGNTKCWSYPPAPEPKPAPAPLPTPAPEPQTYQLGDWFPSLDGCNKCTCTNNGIMCTVQVCAPPPPPPPAPGCEWSGKKIEPGTSFSDGCNTCSCGPDGQLACTARACPPPPEKGCEVNGKWMASGTSYNDGCNTCSCGADGQVTCTEKACEPLPLPPEPAPSK
jgi:hypothetical protein